MDTGAVKEIYGKRSERVFSLELDDYVFALLKIHDFKRELPNEIFRDNQRAQYYGCISCRLSAFQYCRSHFELQDRDKNILK